MEETNRTFSGFIQVSYSFLNVKSWKQRREPSVVHTSEFCVFAEEKIQSEMETISEVGSHEELSCWQIWRHIASDLTRCQDSRIKRSEFHQQHDSPGQNGARLSVIHTGQTPSQCNECTKPFGDLSNFDIHEQIHSGEKSHTCCESGKSFCYSSALHIHQRVLLGEKRYKCDECGKEFRQFTAANSSESPHCREAIQMWAVWERLQS